MLSTESLDPYLRTREAAAFLNLSPRTLEKMRVRGDGPRYFKRGRLCFYALSELKRWMEADPRTSTSQHSTMPYHTDGNRPL